MTKSGIPQVVSISINVASSGFGGTEARAIETEHAFWTFLSLLHDVRLITHPARFFSRKDDRVSVEVQCPHLQSLLETQIAYIVKWKNTLQTLTGEVVQFEHFGISVSEQPCCLDLNSSFLILRDYGFSPLVCGDTHNAIPLFLIPGTTDEGRAHDDIRWWSNAYERLYGLWLGSSVGEEFALNQMQDHDSELSKMGRAACKRVEEVTGVPTFYYLMNYRSWTVAEDRARRCPETGQEWLIPGEALKGEISFKCDASRLVSELSKNCSDQ